LLLAVALHKFQVGGEGVYSARLDHIFPAQRFFNYASDGWGPDQSYLRTRDVSKAGTSNLVNLVIYGLYSDHRHRNIARNDWITALTDTRRRYIIPPHVQSLWGEDLTPRGMEYVNTWTGESSSVVITLLHEFYLLLFNPPRTITHMYAVMHHTTLNNLRHTSAPHGTDLLVVFLVPPDPLLQDWLNSSGVNSIDCANPDWHKPEYKVGGIGYPNAKQHALWAECIANELDDRGWIRAGGTP